MLMMTPWRWAIMDGSTAREARNTDVRSTLSILFQSCSVMSRKGFSAMMPALLTNTPIGPKLFSTCSTMSASSPALVTSASTTQARAPRFAIWAAS